MQPRRIGQPEGGAGPESGSRVRLVSVCSVGQFDKVAFVAMPVEDAIVLFGSVPVPVAVVLEGVMRDLELFAEKDEHLAGSSLAGAAIAMALEVENPYNSATSKSMCTNALRESIAQLRELLPKGEEGDEFDELRAAREDRRTRAKGASA